MRLLCFGDSNTYGYDPRSYFGGRYDPQNRWVDLLAEKKDWVVLNAGQNGREIPRRPHELEQLRQWPVLYGDPDAVLVMLGDNDLLQGTSVEAVTARMEAFLRQLLSVCSTVLLIAPPPLKRGTWVMEEHLLKDSACLSDAYQMLAQHFGVPFIDTRGWGLELSFDGVHFSENDHHIFAKQLFLALSDSGLF